MTHLAVFDLDGTLVDSVPDLHAALDRLAVREGLAPYGRAEVTRMIGDGIRVLVQRALAARQRPFTEAVLEAFTGDYTSKAAGETRLFPGTAEALDALEAAGWRLAVCTNKPAAATARLLQALGLAQRFAVVGAGDSFPTRKPDPAHLLGTIAAAGATPAEAVMIGDHRNDIQAALGASVPAVFAAWGYGLPAMAEGAAAVANTPAELPALLARWG